MLTLWMRVCDAVDSARQRLFGGGILGGHEFLERPYGLRGMGKRGRNVGKN